MDESITRNKRNIILKPLLSSLYSEFKIEKKKYSLPDY